MSTRTLLILSHLMCTLSAGAAVAAWFVCPPWIGGAALLAVVCILVAAAGSVSSRFARGLHDIEQTVATGELPIPLAGGVRELSATIRRVAECSQRWAETTTTHREQVRQLQAMLGQIDRRAGANSLGPQASPVAQFRQLLAGLATTLDADLAAVRGCSAELDHCTRELASSAEGQGEAVTKATTYVEQLSAHFDTIATNAKTTGTSVVEARSSSQQALELLRTLRQGVDQIHDQLEGSERRVSALMDRSHEIRALVETISDLAARTDLLALNASLESIRAGDQGRGFAIVADEVRKLAEQTKQASREAVGLADAAELETRESVNLLVQHRTRALEELQRADAAGRALELALQKSDESAQGVTEITRAAQLQLQLTRDLVLTVEYTSGAAKASRSRAEKACWTAKNLGNTAQHLDSTLAPLRRCVQTPAARPALQQPGADTSGDGLDYPRYAPADQTSASALSGTWNQAAGHTCPTS